MSRLILLLLCALLGFGAYLYEKPQTFLRLKDTFLRRQAQVNRQDTLLSLAYALGDAQWLDFQLPQATKRLRLITNTVIPASSAEELDLLEYSIQYQLYNGDTGQILYDGVYFFHTKLTLNVDLPKASQQATAFFPDPDTLPTDGRLMQLDLEGLDDKVLDRRIRFKKKSLSEPGSAILARLYALQQSALQKGQTDWARLQRKKREKLARGNVYPYDLLTSVEINNILQSRWVPVGPSGIPGQDYTVEKMYIRQELTDNPLAPAPLPPAHIAGPDTLVTLPIPEEGRNLLIHFKRRTNELSEGKIQLRWYGRQAHENLSWRVPLQDFEEEITQHFDGGLLEFDSSVPVSISFFDGDNNLQELVPQPMLTRMYPLDGPAPLSFRIRHIEGMPTPLRMTLRSFSSEALPENLELQYALLDKDGALRSENTIKLRFTRTRYDAVLASEQPLTLSEPVVLFLEAAPDITEIQFTGPPGLLVSVANRPPAYRREILVPESSYYAGEIRTAPSWFSYPPQSNEFQADSPESVLVRLQHKPPSRNVELLEGEFYWKGFRPEGAWQGYSLLTPKNLPTSTRKEALGSTFREIFPEKPLQATFSAFGSISLIKPRLAFIREEGEPLEISLSLDGMDWLHREIIGKRGIISLPPLPSGPHRINLSVSQTARFFLSNIEGDGKSWLLRQVYRLPEKGLKFKISKQQPRELLSFFYTTEQQSSERTRLQVDLLGEKTSSSPAPLNGLTLQKRLYDIRTGDQPPLPIMTDDNQSTDAGQRFFLPLEEDLPEGEYLIRISPERPQNGFIAINRVLPGSYDWGYFFKEATR